ncbi:MAG: pentapeptide repeat-containing protein, partial [Erysipelotrichaceae bacterium]|nr:pentapeptide repeat-containing protein [Erysipelotrichaceae bacterium]
MRKQPRIMSVLDEVTELKRGQFHQMFDLQIKDLENHEDLDELEFNGCVFEKVNFNQCDFSHAALIDCVLDHCDLSNVDLTKSCFRRVVFQQCNLVGVDVSQC